MTGSNLTKILDFMPRRIRMADVDLEIAETDAGKRTEQYMTVKDWVTKTQRTLIRQGIKLEEKAETAVTMITTVTNNEKRGKNPERESQRGNKGNRKYQQDGRYGGNRNQPAGRTITECRFCNLIKEKDVPQESVRKEFGEIHRGIPDRPVRPN